MAGELLSFGIQKLYDLLSKKHEQFHGVKDQVTELESNLLLLKSFLKDAGAKKHTSDLVRHCVEEIKEIVYDAEDIIETYLLKEDQVGKTSGIKKRIRRLACIFPYRMQIASDMGGISRRISKVIHDMERFGVQKLIVDDSGFSHPLQERQKMKKKEFAREYESDLVGLEANINKLIGYLVKEDNVQVVSITGMGGLGKTTLARQVFNHEDVKHKFHRLAWVCVSQDFTHISVWQTILQNLTSKERKDEILKMNEAELQDELFGLLKTSKSLIVFDDIWEDGHWDQIKPIFPPNKGWKVLLTSRKNSVAVRPNETYKNLKPECLTTEESLTLFQKIAHPINDASELKIDEEMEEIGKEMVKHCGGLPLAIKVLGGMLAEKYTLHYWKQVAENIGSHLVGGSTDFNDADNSSVKYLLSLSFEELPSYLKQCFLYLAHFPEDHKIKVKDLSYYWAAEGIFEPRHYDGETIQDVGDSYIEELVQRNMVISGRDVTTLRYETCHLHDMMREICLFKAKEDNFLQIASTHPSTSNFQSPGTSRRFVSQNPTTLSVERDISNPKLRSLMVNDFQRVGWKLSGSSFKRLELLRVLDLFRAEFEGGKLPSGIGKLIHLRYLSLEEAEVSHLPASIGNLVLLIYLNLDIADKDILVPNALMGMKELRYLALPEIMQRKTKLELSNLVKLETLENFSTKNSSIEDLRGMVRLRTLKMKLTDETSIETVSASIGGLEHLEDLYIGYKGSKRNVEEGIVLDFSHLKRLTLFMYMPNLLKEQHFPSHLTTLSLRMCGLEEDPMPILEKLLQLKEVTIWDSFSGKRMVCSGGGFPQLQKLEFWGLEEWEEWIVEEGSMPLLHTLSIYYCRKLKELPDGLRFITSLKELNIYRCNLKFNEKLSRGGEDFYKVQHIPLLKIKSD
ncbi:putative disease resistance protein [Cardamine amara subsp. amara]|uniref:Disease resistance protein n=1 Tax=Cardamine amara subsp. amara TaxID=228776 RepID=A0ABD0ZI93_CARAN